MSQQVAEVMLRKKNLPGHQKEKFLQMHDQESLTYITPPKRENVFFHLIGSFRKIRYLDLRTKMKLDSKTKF